MIKVSRYGFAETVTRLSDAIVADGSRIFATIDQAAAARSADLTLRPTALILFGNPKIGTALMDANPLVGLELPLKFILWEDAGVVRVGYGTMSEFTARYGLNGNEAVLAGLDRALDALSTTVA